jgi:L-asparagine transporter-like permease
MKLSFKDKYQWKNKVLQKKAKLYDYLTLIAGVGVLVVLFFAPQSIKMLNLLLIVVGGVFWYLSYQAKQKDRKIK